MTAELPEFHKFGNMEIRVGETVYVHEHRRCSGNRGKVINVFEDNIQVKCLKCRRDDIVIDLNATRKSRGV